MHKEIHTIKEKLKKGGDEKYHQKNTESGKLFARKRIELFTDPNSFVEDGVLANNQAEGLPADGVVTGLATVDGRRVAIIANDSTIKAGSWGARTVEKMLRIQELAKRLQLPICYLIDSAGARITDQVEMFPGRRGAGRIFYNQSQLSGIVPQICVLFGPSAAGGAYIPAFCDIVIMVEGNASMYLGSPRMAEAVIGEKVTLEEMGGAKMHCSQSGCGDFLAANENDAILLAKKYLSYLPGLPRTVAAEAPEKNPKDLGTVVPDSNARAYDMKNVVKSIVDKGSFFEIKELYAKEILTGFGRIEGEVIGIVANQPLVKGGVIFAESANKAARFIQLCSAYGIPLLFISDVPGFMIGSKVEREGIIRAGAKMIYALSNAEVSKICLIVRKAFGAGLYAMAGPAFESDCVIALPTAQIAVMGPEPAVNAVYFNKIEALPEADRKKFIAEKIAVYEKDVDLMRLSSELVIDDIIDFAETRSELAKRFQFYKDAPRAKREKPGILPM
jgi:acetyl-CoA carboxylase carboxyltransferase component